MFNINLENTNDQMMNISLLSGYMIIGNTVSAIITTTGTTPLGL
ncbi:hypothetical protein [Polluticaenibacter yanchengensis]|uniref:Uncharacterized protein n=1 Tax=Polluticaenibacter yanchengensis TaxID=3014562 RepID=A0ABT4UMM0_9BACT|nr:hypothetical protein [Chitinophagaceae bacterium LY-5]